MLHFWKFKKIWMNVEYTHQLDMGHPNHFSFKLHNCKSSNFCCCSTHFSYKWEQLLMGKNHKSCHPIQIFFFFCKRPFVCKIKDYHAGHFLKKKLNHLFTDKYPIWNFNHLSQPKFFEISLFKFWISKYLTSKIFFNSNLARVY